MRKLSVIVLCAAALASCETDAPFGDPFADISPGVEAPQQDAMAPSPQQQNGPVTAISAVTGATSMQLYQALQSDDPGVVDAALAAAEANPGAYLPVILARAARVRFEHGDTQEAVAMDRFAYFRMLADLNYMRSVNTRADHQAVQLVGSFAADEGEDLAAHIASLPSAERGRIADAAIARDATTPRRYPHDWALTGRDAYEQNWVAAPTSWTPEQRAAFDRFLPEMTEAFRATESEPRAPANSSAPAEEVEAPDINAPPLPPPRNAPRQN